MKRKMQRSAVLTTIIGGGAVILAGALLHDGQRDATAAIVTPAASVSPGYDGAYVVTDNGTGAPVLADTFIDASGGAGTQFTSDDSYISVTAPFALQVFGGAPTTSLRVHDNGYITLGTSSSSFPTNEALPTKQTGGDATIAAFWDDLYPKTTTTVYTETTGTTGSRQFVIEWNDIAHFDDQTASYQFEVVFFEQKPGEVLIQYGTMTDGTGAMGDGRSATIGVQAAGGGAYTTVAVDQSGAVSSALSVDFDVDSDHDGLSDAVEDSNRDGVLDTGETDPSLFDTDGGGTGDGAEVIVQSTDPRASGDDAFADGDSDGLSDNDEMVLGTNGAVADTDGDGLDDGVEVMTLGCSPLLRDTDGDLLTDFDEVDLDGDPSSYTAGTDTDPTVADTDGGGQRDGSELINGRDPNDGGDDLVAGVLGPFNALSVSSDSRSVVDVAVDGNDDVHVVQDWRGSDYYYSMMKADGTTLISDTSFSGIGGNTRYTKVLALPSGHVAMVWAEGSTGGGNIGYRLIDPTLDDQSGNAANPALNPNNPPTVGNGVTLVQRVAVSNPDGTAQGYSHLDAALGPDGAIHMTFQRRPRNGGRGDREVWYMKIKGEGGAPLMAQPLLVYTVAKPFPNSNDHNPTGVPVHPRNVDSITVDAQGYAHIVFGGFSRRMRRGGPGDVRYARIAPDGTVDFPLTKIVSAANGHFGSYGISSDGTTTTLVHTANVARRSTGDIELTQINSQGAILRQRMVDGPSVDGVSHYFREPRAVRTASGNIAVTYQDRFHDESTRLTLLGPSGDALLPPTTLFAGSDTNGRRGPKVDVAAGPNVVAAAYYRNDGRVRVSTLNVSDASLGTQALVNVTVAKGGSLKVDNSNASLYGASAVFGANDTTADTWATISAGGAEATPPGAQVGSTARVSFQTGGAVLAASATYQIRMPVPADYTGNPANLSIYQGDSGGWTALTTTVDGSTTPTTLVATATALAAFGVFEPTPTVAFTSTAPTTATVGEAYSYVPTVTSSAPVTFQLLTAPSGMSVDTNSGELQWTPSSSQLGMNAVVLQVDNGFNQASQSFAVTVSLFGNTAPVFTSSPPVLGDVGVAYDYMPEVLDPDTAQTLTFSLYTAPSGMTIDSATGEIQWTPDDTQRGANPVSIGVSDGIATATQIFAITIPSPETPPNSPPMFTSAPVLQGMPGVAYQYTAAAVDDNGDTLTFALGTAPSGMSIDGSSGAVTWTPGDGDAGTVVPVSITVTDGTATVSQIFSVTIGGADSGGGGCCSTGGHDSPAGGVALGFLVLGLLFRPRRRRRR